MLFWARYPKPDWFGIKIYGGCAGKGAQIVNSKKGNMIYQIILESLAGAACGYLLAVALRRYR